MRIFRGAHLPYFVEVKAYEGRLLFHGLDGKQSRAADGGVDFGICYASGGDKSFNNAFLSLQSVVICSSIKIFSL